MGGVGVWMSVGEDDDGGGEWSCAFVCLVFFFVCFFRCLGC